MLDIKFIRENIDAVKKAASEKNCKVDIDKLIKLDDKRRMLMQKIEELRTKKNVASRQIPMMSESERSAALREMKEVDEAQEKFEDELKEIKNEFTDLMFLVPMIVDERTPRGIDESGNVEIFRNFEPPKFKFVPKSHIQIGNELDIIDMERGAKVGGSRSYILKGDGARLEAALIKYAEDFISRKNYKLLSVPVIVNRQTLYGTGHFPGAEEETYYLQKDDKYLAGTSEVAIASMHADEILNEADLPLRYAAFSVCFRREAGSYGKDTQGLYRVHQFMKVEQFIICKNDHRESYELHEELLSNSQEFLQNLKLPYRVLNICTGDMGQGKYYMNDIETWMPSRESYGETHSCSTLHDFQARRLNIRYKTKEGKINFCHTLNNTVVATPRILIPILEMYQNEDGTVTIPEVLRPYMDNQELIG
ncbi:serine--tRNA ligase [Patescibacteria group bacterium]|nr:serine--tRNA ligase [Patescibacteria group bacterium]